MDFRSIFLKTTDFDENSMIFTKIDQTLSILMVKSVQIRIDRLGKFVTVVTRVVYKL